MRDTHSPAAFRADEWSIHAPRAFVKDRVYFDDLNHARWISSDSAHTNPPQFLFIRSSLSLSLFLSLLLSFSLSYDQDRPSNWRLINPSIANVSTYDVTSFKITMIIVTIAYWEISKIYVTATFELS